MPRGTPTPPPPPGSPAAYAERPPGPLADLYERQIPRRPSRPAPGSSSARSMSKSEQSSRSQEPLAKRDKAAENSEQLAKTDATGKEIVEAADPYPLKPIPPNVLQEEDFVDAVSHIIERDFFPDLPTLRARHELMQARLAGDEGAVRDAEWKLVNLARPTPLSTPASTPHPGPGATPLGNFAATPGTPAGHADAAGARLSAWERDDDAESTVTSQPDGPECARMKLADGREVVVDLTKVRLDDFQRVFTSEDNASFEELVKKDKDHLRSKYWWMEDMERKHNTEHRHYAKQLVNGAEYATTGALLGNEFKARNMLSFKPESLPQAGIDVPKVDFKNTRFTTAQQGELDAMLAQGVMLRKMRMEGEQEAEALDQMVQKGNFSLSSLPSGLQGPVRAVGGRLHEPLLPTPESNGYNLVRTPALLPGEGGLSPLMTYGKLASTPRPLEEEGPNYRMFEESDRERAAQKLQHGASQRQREAKTLSKAERLRALGITTPESTPKAKTSRSTPASSWRRTPGSAVSSGKVAHLTPMSPIGALLHRAQRLAQKGGQFHIASNKTTPTEAATPEGPPRKRHKKTPAADGASSSSLLPASITDNLL
mmetsp:Transcript_34097/g.62540  ORF Transcript_34097/g.62540 Transcript_34097/m.62540 type:complete len:598 (-) Transcript_34097:62-1855(-)